MDFVYLGGPAIMTVVFAVFAITTDPERQPILRNLFYLATLASLLLVANMSISVATSGDWVVGSSTFHADTNVTNYTYEQKAPSFNANDFTNVYVVLTTVIWIVFAWLILSMFIKVIEETTKTLDMWRRKRRGGA